MTDALLLADAIDARDPDATVIAVDARTAPLIVAALRGMARLAAPVAGTEGATPQCRGCGWSIRLCAKRGTADNWTEEGCPCAAFREACAS